MESQIEQQSSRPKPTTDDILQGKGAAQSGYLDPSYLQTIRDYGDWEVERVRAVRRPFGSVGTLTENPFTRFAVNAISGFKPSPGQNNRIHHAYLDTVLRNPFNGEMTTVRVEKGPFVHTTVGGDVGMGLAKGNEAIDLTHKIREASNGGQKLTFRQFSRGALDSHAQTHAGNYTSIGRYNIAGGNCQNFALDALRGSSLLDDKTKTFLYEPKAANLSKFMQNTIDDYVYGRKGLLNPFADMKRH